MSNNTGGPAFPFVHDMPPPPDQPAGTRLLKVYDGMTLRDYFAAKSMQAELTIFGNMPSAEIARRAYEMADAMLKARD